MTLALLYPVAQLIWVVSVRRLQKRLQRPLDQPELRGQRQRAFVIGMVVSLAFSMLFNFRLLN